MQAADVELIVGSEMSLHVLGASLASLSFLKEPWQLHVHSVKSVHGLPSETTGGAYVLQIATARADGWHPGSVVAALPEVDPLGPSKDKRCTVPACICTQHSTCMSLLQAPRVTAGLLKYGMLSTFSVCSLLGDCTEPSQLAIGCDHMLDNLRYT